MSIGMWKTHEWRTRHFKVFQHAVIHQSDALCRHPLIIELVVAQKILRSESPHRSIVADAQKFRQNLFSDFFREGLPLGYVFLPVPFGAVAEDFVEKGRGGPGRHERRAYGRIVDRRRDQPSKFLE